MITRDNYPASWENVPAWTEVSEEVYDNFLNVLPPIEWCGGYFQMSEPYTHEKDKNGRWRAKYMTFTKRDDRFWYLGIQHRGDYPNMNTEEASYKTVVAL